MVSSRLHTCSVSYEGPVLLMARVLIEFPQEVFDCDWFVFYEGAGGVEETVCHYLGGGGGWEVNDQLRETLSVKSTRGHTQSVLSEYRFCL